MPQMTSPPISPASVLMVNKFLYRKGGAEMYMFELAEMLRHSGMHTSYFGMDDPRNADDKNAETFPSYVDFDEPDGTRAKVRAVGRMLYSRDARSGMARMLARDHVDVAHLHNIYHQLSPSILGPLRDAGIPIVMTAHDYKLVCPVYTLTASGTLCTRCVGGSPWNAALHRCNRGSISGSAAVALESAIHRRRGAYEPIDVLIAPSEYLRERLIDGGHNPERVEVVPNFADCEAFDPTQEPGDHVLYAGRLSHEKGIDVLINSVAGTSIRLRVAGDGPERDALERLAARTGADVEFLGHLSRAGLRRELESALAVAVPSTWPENCPLIVLEAMAAGRAVVLSDVGGLPELARDGQEGLLVPAGDVRALRDALLTLQADHQFARRLGRAGRERAVVEFNPERHLVRILGIYRGLGVAVGERAAA